jgi:hypothetical protein
MTPHTDLLGQLRRQWHHVAHDESSRLAFERLRGAHPALDLSGLHDLGDVVDALETRSALSVLERAALVRVLLEGADDVTTRRALLQTLLPGVVSVCRQLRFGEGIVRDPGETMAVALGLATELLIDWSGQSRQFAAPDLLSALRGRLRRYLMKEKAVLGSLSLFDEGDEPAADASSLETRLASLRGSEYDRLVRLTYARVFEGRSLRDLAREDHCAPSSLQAELQRFAVRFLL